MQTAAVYCDKEAAHLRRPDPSCNDCLRQEWLRETVKLYPPLGVLAILKQNVKHTHSATLLGTPVHLVVNANIKSAESVLLNTQI